jgi:hypothetical protein
MPFVETTPPAGSFTEVTEPNTSRDSWTEYDSRTGANHQISQLYQTTIAGMNRAGITLDISELIDRMSWTETI